MDLHVSFCDNAFNLYRTMLKKLPLPAILLLLLACHRDAGPKTVKEPLYRGQQLNTAQTLHTIAFGSCAHEYEDQPIWPFIRANNPQLWIWMGDIVYGDTEDMALLERKYQQQKNRPEYAQFRSAVPVIGIWDDHDYGVNDGDKRYAKRVESQKLLLDFLDVPPDAPARKRKGAYQSFVFGPEGRQVKIILLDGRYFRDPLEKTFFNGNLGYQPKAGLDMLGEAQWRWLEAELHNSAAQVHLIACGIQFLPEEHRFEKWANFPDARQRLLQLLAKYQPANAVLLSGDRYIAELSRITLPDLPQDTIYEITSSGLTHTWSLNEYEPNQHRVGDMVIGKNFGVLRIDWSGKEPVLTAEVRGLGNELYLKYSW